MDVDESCLTKMLRFYVTVKISHTGWEPKHKILFLKVVK